MSKSPAFQFYPGDWLSDEKVMLLTLEEEGAFIRLICICWKEGSIPADSSAIAQLCKGCSLAIASHVTELFTSHPTRPGRLVHPRLEREREKQVNHSKERRESGLRGANKRWKRDSSAIQQPLAKHGSSSSSSSSSSDSITPISPSKSKPSIDEVKLQCAKIGIPESEGESFLDYYEANGWRVGRNPMKSWVHALSNWKRNWEAKGRPTPGANGTPKPRSTWETKTSMEAKRARAKELRDRHYSQHAMGGEWDSDKHRSEYLELKKEADALERTL